jgi:hypothetical protein
MTTLWSPTREVKVCVALQLEIDFGLPSLLSRYSGMSRSNIHSASLSWTQNTTFGGIRGFTRKPSTPWELDNGTFGGIVHQVGFVVLFPPIFKLMPPPGAQLDLCLD